MSNSSLVRVLAAAGIDVRGLESSFIQDFSTISSLQAAHAISPLVRGTYRTTLTPNGYDLLINSDGTDLFGQGYFDSITALQTAHAASPLPQGQYTVAGSTDIYSSDGANLIRQTTLDTGGIYNFKASNYKISRKALANTKLGVSNTDVLILCDSIGAGFVGSAQADRRVANSWVTRLAIELSAQVNAAGGLYGGWQNWINDHNAMIISDTLPIYDPRVTIGAGWGLFDTLNSGLGGSVTAWNSTTTNTLLFAPTVNTDTCDIYYFDNTGYNQMTVLSGTGGVTAPTTGGTITHSGAGRWKKATATYTLGANIWSVARSATGTVGGILGMKAYDSSKKEVSFLNCAGQGNQLSTLLAGTNPWHSWPTITATGNTLTGSPLAIIGMGTNDAGAAVSQATFQARLITAITGLQAVGTDVLLLVPYLCGPNNPPNAYSAGIGAAYYAAALQTDCALIDLNSRFGASGVAISTATNAGLLGSDGIHPATVGHQDIAAAVAGFIKLLSA